MRCLSLYVVVCRLFEFVVLLARGDRSKELEILVLRHELSILRRQVARLRLSSGDRLLFIRTPIQAPNANAYAERWVGSVRRERLDRILIFGRRQLDTVLRVYACHYNQHRPHRALELGPPTSVDGPLPRSDPSTAASVQRHDLLGGLLHEYKAAA